MAISASCAVGLGKVARRLKVVKSDQQSLSFTVVPTFSARRSRLPTAVSKKIEPREWQGAGCGPRAGTEIYPYPAQGWCPPLYISRLGVDWTVERLDILNIEREGGLPRNGLRSMFDNHGSVVETAGVASEGTARLSETALQ